MPAPAIVPSPHRPRRAAALAIAGAALALAACQRGDSDDTVPSVGTVRRSGSPAGSASAMPRLTLGADGRVVFSWLERTGDTSIALRTVSRDAAGLWDWPHDVTRGAPSAYFVNWADFPSAIRLAGGTLVAHWLAREGRGTYAYGVRIARSSDNGATWSAPVTPHTDGLEAEHGFVSLWDAGNGDVGAVWLDGRKSAMPDSTREMTLRTARIDRSGALHDETVLDARICDCCQTATAATRRGRVIVYRDRSGDEIRDIAVVRQVDGAWRAPVRVHPDGWRITGCPVNGPAVVARGDTVAVAWFTRAGDTARVLVAVSTDAGAMFDAPVRIDDGVPLGRVAIALDPESRPIVAWLEQVAPSRAQLRVRRVTLDGRRSAATTVASVEAARASGVPQMVALRDSLLLAWTSPVPVPKIRVAAVPFR